MAINGSPIPIEDWSSSRYNISCRHIQEILSPYNRENRHQDISRLHALSKRNVLDAIWGLRHVTEEKELVENVYDNISKRLYGEDEGEKSVFFTFIVDENMNPHIVVSSDLELEYDTVHIIPTNYPNTMLEKFTDTEDFLTETSIRIFNQRTPSMTFGAVYSDTYPERLHNLAENSVGECIVLQRLLEFESEEGGEVSNEWSPESLLDSSN